MHYVVPPPIPVDLAIANTTARFPVHRVYGVRRNHDARDCRGEEAAFAGSRAPGLYWKPADLVMAAGADQVTTLPCAGPGQSLRFEVELVVMIGRGGRRIRAEDAASHIYGFAVGVVATPSAPTQAAVPNTKKWDDGVGVNTPACVGPVVAAADAPGHAQAALWLRVDGAESQRSSTSAMLWDVGRIIEYLSADGELRAGDIIFTGSPSGAGVARAGANVSAGIDGIGSLDLLVAHWKESA